MDDNLFLSKLYKKMIYEIIKSNIYNCVFVISTVNNVWILFKNVL